MLANVLRSQLQLQGLLGLVLLYALGHALQQRDGLGRGRGQLLQSL